MKTCKGCKYAEWDRTKTGRLSPTGDGECKYNYKIPKLPVSMWFSGRVEPSIHGGHINRKEELKEHCVYWQDERL